MKRLAVLGVTAMMVWVLGLSQMCAAAEQPSAGLADGSYTMEVELEGGSGKTTVESPAAVTVKDGRATARICWSSPNYDYMVVDGEKYLPVNTEGNSVFEIPVPAFDEAIPVIGNTVAMSKPREIEYQLIFHSATAEKAQQGNAAAANLVFVLVIVAAGVVVYILQKRKK